MTDFCNPPDGMNLSLPKSTSTSLFFNLDGIFSSHTQLFSNPDLQQTSPAPLGRLQTCALDEPKFQAFIDDIHTILDGLVIDSDTEPISWANVGVPASKDGLIALCNSSGRIITTFTPRNSAYAHTDSFGLGSPKIILGWHRGIESNGIIFR